MTERKKRKEDGGGRRLYLVDASSYAFRAYHATAQQGLSTSKGIPTGATLVFTNMLLKLIRQEKPTHLVVVWDARGKTFRHEKFPAYKANRLQMPSDLSLQLDYMHKIVSALNLPSLEKPGFEADDVIGALAQKAREEGVETVIVSGDKDLTQLLSPRVTLLDTLKDIRTDVSKVRERFGVDPEKVVDILALWGDSSDNIPGVPKVGEKTAIKLIQEYGDLEGVLAHAHEIKGVVGQNLREFADQARLSRELVTIVTDLDLGCRLEDFRLREPDHQRLTELFQELQFNKLLHEFSEQKAEVSDAGYRLILSTDELEKFVEEAKKSPTVSVDTETTALDPLRAELVGISLAVRPGEAVYIPTGHVRSAAERQLRREEALAVLKPLLADDSPSKIGQNLKYDYQVLTRAGVELRGLGFDTMIASYLVNPKRRTHNLAELASEYLGHKMITYEEVTGKGKNQKSFAEVPLEQALAYSGEDADVALRLSERLARRLREMELMPVFEQIEMPLLPVLARMEMTGVKIDTALLAELSRRFGKEAASLKQRVFELCGEEFNLDSPRQLGEVLFKKLKLPTAKKTKTGFSTSMEVLQKLAAEHEVPRLLLEYRSLTKLISTYTEALPRLVSPETGRVHTSYNQTVTSTGRLSSSDPNLQNIPVRTEVGRQIRQAFIGEGKNLILSADYSQVELRLMAHLSGEPALLSAFEKGEDIHTATAAEVFGVSPSQVTPELRRRAKAINFGIMYGMSAHGLSTQLGIDHQEAQDYIDRYFRRYPRIQFYMQSVVAEARVRGYVQTIMGRRLPVPEIYSANFLVRQAAEREAINAPLQGSAADIIKIAMIRIDRALAEEKMKSRMIMQVHDELVFEAPPAELSVLEKLVKEKMETAAELKVKLVVEASAGKSWAEAH